MDDEETYKVSAVGVHFAAEVALEDVDLGLVDESDDLDVVGRLHELHASERTLGDETRPMAGLCAPGDHRPLDVANFATVFRRGPETEICSL